MIDANVAKRVRDALYGQKYNLLLGAGVSLDATDRRGKPLLGAEELRTKLCTVTDSRPSSPLWRVAGLLNPAQIHDYLTTPYYGCKAGPTLTALTRFAWRTAFTLNIDDAMENAYERNAARLQTLVPINYTREYETFRNPHELPLIHLHGSVRLPDEKYVFSLQEYASVQKGNNPWVHMLSGLIITEPFIIAGTALFEPDLEYFLAHRPSNSQVISRAPSILVEPFPDAGTRRDCEKLNLILVEAKLQDFLSWIINEFGEPPTPLALRQPDARPRALSQPSTFASVAFWSDFDFVSQMPRSEGAQSSKRSPFVFGRAPSWEDIENNLDVPLQGQLALIDEVRRWQGSGEQNHVVCLAGKAGAGKSTTIRRVATELSQYGLQVFYLKALGGFDDRSAFEFLSGVVDPIVLVTDSLAEHGDQLVDLTLRFDKKRICILGTERQYRMRLVNDILADVPHREFQVTPWRVEELTELIKRYSAMGITGHSMAIADPRKFAPEIQTNTAAEAICRILNDFRPLAAIVRSLWNDALEKTRPVYLAVALAHYCHPIGIRQDIITSIYEADFLGELSLVDAPLQVSTNPNDTEYVIPSNPMLAALLVEELARLKPARLLELATELANGLAQFVTRHTIKQRTPEARLAGRLFDADGLMPELLKERFADFYTSTLEKWRWNSRYWEQLALWVGSADRELSIQHARHAVAIERHPYPMTTLANVLFSAISESKPPKLQYFAEALDLMEDTLRIEAGWERGKTRKAYTAVIEGVLAFINAGGKLTPRQAAFSENVVGEALKSFGSDPFVSARGAQALELLKS